jgi:hypothetical protein
MVGEGGRVRVVGDHHDGLAVLVDRAAHEAEQLGARGRVEVAGGLVGEHDRRLGGQRPGRGHPLLLAAGQLGRLVAEALAQPDSVDHPVDPGPVRLAAGDGQGQLEVLGRGEGREQVEGLEHEADLVPAEQGELLLGQLAELDVADEDLPGGDPVQPGQAVHQGRLAGAGRAHDGGEPAARELDRDVVKGPDLGLALPVDLGHLDGPRGQRLGGVAGHGGS